MFTFGLPIPADVLRFHLILRTLNYENMEITPGIIEMLVPPQSCILVSQRNSSKLKGVIVAWDLLPKESMKRGWERKGQQRV